MGDIIRQDGWDLKAYRNNPVVLFGHDHAQPIGRAHNVRIDKGNLAADFEFAPEEVNPFAAQVGRMVEAGFLKAVSVGFRPLEAKPMKSGGLEFTKSELLEISVVSVPANAEALSFAKSFATPSDIRRLFAEQSLVVRSRVRAAQTRAFLASHGEIASSPFK
jgi:HK97 family phage prohead protease